MIERILVVCVGNICRSPMAEAVLRHALRGKQGITVESAGLGALVGSRASRHSIELMAERNLDISAHKARQLTPEMVHNSDLVLVMERDHKRVISEYDPAARGKVFRYCEWQGEDIPDPVGQPRSVYEEVLEMIDRGTKDWVDRITA